MIVLVMIGAELLGRQDPTRSICRLLSGKILSIASEFTYSKLLSHSGRMQRRCAGRVKGWTEIKFADELRIGGVADVEIHHCRRISHRCHLAVGADIGRSMKSLRALRFGLARLFVPQTSISLTYHSPFIKEGDSPQIIPRHKDNRGEISSVANLSEG
jgi:hypothetical protein